MPVLPLIEESQAQGQVAELYAKIKSSLGLKHVPNTFKAMAHSPAFLADTLENHLKVMGAGALDTKTKELIAIAVSAVNGCHYCLSAHASIGRAVGLSDALIAEAVALAGIMAAHNHFQKFKDHCGEEAFKPMRFGLTQSLMKTRALSELQAELIFVCVSSIDACGTCIKHHTGKAKAAGATPEQFQEAAAVMNLLTMYNTFNKAMGLTPDI